MFQLGSAISTRRRVDTSDISAIFFDGIQGRMAHTGGPTGAADGATFTFVWAGEFESDGATMTLLDIPGTVPVKVVRQSDNTIDFVGGTAGAVFSNSTTAVAASLGFLAVFCSCNGTTSVLKVVHASGTITGTNTAGSASNLDLTADWHLGCAGGTSEFLHATASMWWADDSEIDFSDDDNIEQFWDTIEDKLRDPGPSGSNPTDGSLSPLVCHVVRSNNLGTGGDADVVTVLTTGTSPGTYAEDFAGAGSSIPAVVWNSGHLSGNNRRDSDSRYGIISFWFRRTTLSTTQYIHEAANTSRGRLVWGAADNKLYMLLTNNAGTPVVGSGFNSSHAITSAVEDTNWHHIIISWDTATATASGTFKVYLDGVDQAATTGAAGTDTASGADLNRGDFLGNNAAGTARFQGEIAQFYMNFNHTSYYDLSVSANREKFYDSANHLPRDLGLDGTAVGLAQPNHLLQTSAATYGTNAGTHVNWTINGTFSEAAVGPGAAQPQP